MSKAAKSILTRLRENRATNIASVTDYRPQYGWSQQQKIDRLTELMTAVRTEVVMLDDGNWVDWLNHELPKRNLQRALIGNNDDGQHFKARANESIEVKIYDQPIEQWKDDLFNQIDVGITGCLGGIADTGSLILWPDDNEPRLMSLVPPVHIALLHTDKIHESFAAAVEDGGWAQNMPTNALLISGPSKTADIEQTLTYGIHGPQQLIVLLLQKRQ